MTLSRFFTLDELTFSNTAKAEGISNQPDATAVASLQALCGAVLDPLREAAGRPIKVNSGYRGAALNKRLKGALKSQHLTGQAADIQAPGMAVVELFKLVIRLKLPFDQVIYEVNGGAKWVHVSHNAAGNGGEILLAHFGTNGSVTYPRITEQQALAMSEPATRSMEMAAAPGYVEGADEPPRRARARATRKTPVSKAARKTPAARKTTS